MKNDKVSDELRRYEYEFHIFEELYPRVDELLERFGRPNYVPDQPPGDYTVHGDYGGYPQVVVFVQNLQLLSSTIVSALQALLKDFPCWQIDLMVAIRGHYRDWPNMGLSIRQNEIIDALQRHYFPKEFQDISYEGGRAGSVSEFVKAS